jgi:hypothetical protein
MPTTHCDNPAECPTCAPCLQRDLTRALLAIPLAYRQQFLDRAVRVATMGTADALEEEPVPYGGLTEKVRAELKMDEEAMTRRLVCGGLTEKARAELAAPTATESKLREYSEKVYTKHRSRPCMSCGVSITFLPTMGSRTLPVETRSIAPGDVRYDKSKGHVNHFDTCPNAAAHRRRVA